MAVLDQKNEFRLRFDKGWLKVTNFTPHSGIGHFDAAYDPNVGELRITVRLHFSFYTHKEYLLQEQASKKESEQAYVAPSLDQVADSPKWTHGEMLHYKTKFKENAERIWSYQYKFISKKTEWSEYQAKVKVVVDTQAPRGNCHYKVRIFKNPPGQNGRAMVAHDPLWDGIFYETDINLESDNKRDKSHMMYAMRWLDQLVEKTQCDFIEFEKGSTTLTSAAARKIGLFAVSGARYFNGDSERAGVKIWVYSQTGAGEHLTKPTARSEAIANKLKGYLRPHQDIVQVVPKFSKQSWIETYVQRNLKRRTQLADKAITNRSFQGGMLIVKNFAEDSNLITQTTGLPRNYIVSGHEFGHMLGNPDEYQGVRCNALKNEIEKTSILPPGKVDVSNDRLTQQQEGATKLIQAADVPAPFYGTSSLVSESIMYAGCQVLPAHYAPLWEALLNCTWPHMLAADWRIVPDAPNNYKQMY